MGCHKDFSYILLRRGDPPGSVRHYAEPMVVGYGSLSENVSTYYDHSYGRTKKQFKTFEQWLAEKQLYQQLLKEQEQQDVTDNRQPRKLLKGKTFEEWQRELDEKEKKNHTEHKKKQKVKVCDVILSQL